MPSLDQLQSRLRFADSAFTGNQYALAVYIHQYTMHGNTGGKHNVQPADYFSHKSGGRFFGHKNRHILFFRDLKEKGIRMKLSGKYNTGNRIGQQLIINFLLSFLRHGFHIRVFHEADNLKACGLIMLKISRHLKRRPVDVRLGDFNPLYINFRRQIFQLHLFDDLR